MSLLQNKLYLEDVNRAAALPLPWDRLKGSTLLITGASGMIGHYLVDVLMHQNKSRNLGCRILALGRSQSQAEYCFSDYIGKDEFSFFSCDINSPLSSDIPAADYIIHAASNTHPLAYSQDPVGTVTTNVLGTYNLLEYARISTSRRFLFLSSVEIYGENRGDVDKFDESYCGYLNCNTLRAGYPEGKRAGEALCQAYRTQYGLDIVIPRLARTYGPTMKLSDSKAIAQFIKKGAAKENIVLKSEGTQLYSYSYAADAVCAILWLLFSGQDGEAYNIAHESSDITLKELAAEIAEFAGTDVIFELPSETERRGYSTSTKALLDARRLLALGWEPFCGIREGVRRTISILRDVYTKEELI